MLEHQVVAVALVNVVYKYMTLAICCDVRDVFIDFIDFD